MLTNESLSSPAVTGSSNDSWAMTWHQWQAEYPMERKTGRCWRRATSNASSPQGNQSTGLSACCRKYGEVSSAKRFTDDDATGG